VLDNELDGVYNRQFGPWRSLASALAWGARGPEFKSRRPDQIPQRLTTETFLASRVLASNWSPKRTPAGPPPDHTKNAAQIPGSSLLLNKTRQTRHFWSNRLILFVKLMSGF
jgi:hypothetical protein